jgi:hypothetical protein
MNTSEDIVALRRAMRAKVRGNVDGVFRSRKTECFAQIRV